MKQYSIIKATKEIFPYILDVLRMLLGNSIEIKEKENYFIIKHSAIEETEFEATIKSLEEDLNTLISYYQTGTERSFKEVAMIEDSMAHLPYGHYSLKSIIPQITSRKVKNEVFHFITDGLGLNENIIYAMADQDLNVSKASNQLFMHRNTLLYKIDRFNELRGFDLKRFHDLYLLIYLLKA